MKVMEGTKSNKDDRSIKSDPIKAFDDAQVSGRHYKWATLTAMGDFLDAGSIVAGAASVTYWVTYFKLSSLFLGVIAALSPNAFAAWLGALIAGPLGDKYGRKAIYTYDLIAYAIGALIITISLNPFTLIAGYIIMGLAVGIDVPTSWALIAEISPKRGRGRLMSFTNLFWYIGPIVVLLAAIGSSPLGVNTFRVLFGILTASAIITWLLRRGIIESPRWAYIKGKKQVVQDALNKLGSGAQAEEGEKIEFSWTKLFKYWKGLALMIPLYIFWGVPAGTFGFFLPYIAHDAGIKSAALDDLIDIAWFATAIIAIIVVYMTLGDKIDRNLTYAISAAICALGFAIPIFLPITILGVAMANVVLFGFGQGVGLWPINRLWSVELFPTEIRNTAQGFVWAWMRFAIGLWSIFVPSIIAIIGYSAIAAVATAFFVVSIILAILFGPKSQGKSLEEVIRDFYKKE
ncbi:MFS transporter [Acidianus sp. RZ1]|uniref:MFS transporter n=1 Tax=Acidianus sp. RZ1 TaxID=1540082 RepID=UPI0020A31361|nr:MFS transporter [Acidianus sp. RZ1]